METFSVQSRNAEKLQIFHSFIPILCICWWKYNVKEKKTGKHQPEHHVPWSHRWTAPLYFSFQFSVLSQSIETLPYVILIHIEMVETRNSKTMCFLHTICNMHCHYVLRIMLTCPLSIAYIESITKRGTLHEEPWTPFHCTMQCSVVVIFSFISI